MSDTPLPDGLLTMIKTATRALITSCAVPGSSGPERVEQLTGFSRGTISKWQGDNYPDLIPTHVIFILEMTTQKSVFARTLAALTGNQVVPIEGDAAKSGDFMGDMVKTTGTFSRFQTVMSDALEDQEVTPSEAKAGIAAALQHIDTVHATVQRLAAKAETGPRGGR